MRIDSGLPLSNALEVDRTKKKNVQQEGLDSGVKAELSEDVIRLNSLVERANRTGDIREEKVDELRSAIQSGQYQVSDSALADAILRDAIHR